MDIHRAKLDIILLRASIETKQNKANSNDVVFHHSNNHSGYRNIKSTLHIKHNMKKKQEWMFKGAIVLALGQKATITAMQENSLDGVDYVYYIDCKLEGQKHSGRYHPNDIQELVVEVK